MGKVIYLADRQQKEDIDLRELNEFLWTYGDYAGSPNIRHVKRVPMNGKDYMINKMNETLKKIQETQKRYDELHEKTDKLIHMLTTPEQRVEILWYDD